MLVTEQVTGLGSERETKGNLMWSSLLVAGIRQSWQKGNRSLERWEPEERFTAPGGWAEMQEVSSWERLLQSPWPREGQDFPREEWAGRVHSRPSGQCEQKKNRRAKTTNRAEKTTEARTHEECVDCPGMEQGRKSEAGCVGWAEGWD